MKREVFNNEFKLDVVKLVIDRGVSRASAAWNLSIGRNMVVPQAVS